MPERDGAIVPKEALYRYGSDLSRWPDGIRAAAREALLRDSGFRKAWESEQAIDRTLLRHRDEMDAAIARSGAVSRIAARLPRLAHPLSGFHWRSVAAAMVVAAMLGGALDLALVDRSVEPPEAELLDPLAALYDADLR